IHRTDRGARLVIVETDALRALLGHDVEDLARQRGVHGAIGRLPLDGALVDGRIRALGLASPTVDALAGDHRRHRREPSDQCRPKGLTNFAETVKRKGPLDDAPLSVSRRAAGRPADPPTPGQRPRRPGWAAAAPSGPAAGRAPQGRAPRRS